LGGAGRVTLLDHALTYAQRGALVFPLNADKTPATDNGFYDATKDAKQITEWWTRNPNYLIGCRVPDGVVVLDIDPRHNGDKVWSALETSYHPIELGRQHHSGRDDGGFHAWFRHPGGKLSTKALTEWADREGVAGRTDSGKPTCGIDILHHENRYTILPPSPHALTGKPYTWDNEGKPAIMPPWLASLLEPPTPAPPPPRKRLDYDGDDSIADWYSDTARWSDILTGWTVVHSDGESDGSKWRHPTATASWSATIRHGCLFVYSTNTDYKDTEASDPNGYTKFKAYATSHHGGDMSAAGRSLRERKNADESRPAGKRTASNPGADDDSQTARDEPWPEPSPLQGQRSCPEFPVNVLPEWMAAQARQVAQEMQYGPDLPAQLAITAVSLCISGRIEVQVDGPWVEGTNIYTVTAMNASAGKSPAVKHMLGPIKKHEVDLIERSGSIVEDREIERRVIEKERDDAVRAGDKNRAKAAGDDLRKIPPIARPRLIAEDVTPEKLAMLMADQEGRMALISTEGGLFKIMAGRYSEGSNLDVFLQSWSGDDITQDRVGRESLVIRDARLTIGLTVQPSVIAELGDNGEFMGRGLAARFMYSIPRNTVGERDKRRRSTWSDTIDATYTQQLRRLAESYAGNQPCKGRLTLTDEAHDVFVDWQQGHENRMGYNGDLEYLAEWVSKMHSSVCRLAGVILMAERTETIAGMSELHGLPSVIEVDVMLRAMVVGDYWIEHAKIAGDLWGADPEVAKAVRLLRWAEGRRDDDGDTFTIRDAMRGLRKLFPKSESAFPALQILTESGWMRADTPIHEWGRGRGGQSASFTLRPQTTTEGDTCGQVVTHVTHVPKGIIEINQSITKEMGMGAPSDMGDMGDNPDLPVDNPTTTERDIHPDPDDLDQF